jgi:hypothetical protein
MLKFLMRGRTQHGVSAGVGRRWCWSISILSLHRSGFIVAFIVAHNTHACSRNVELVTVWRAAYRAYMFDDFVYNFS